MPPPPARVLEADPREQREEEEQSRLDVLQLRHPCDGLHMDGMQGEDRPGKPGAPDPELAQQPDQEQGVGGMEHNVELVIRNGIKAPEPALDPESRGRQGIVENSAAPERLQPSRLGHERVFAEVFVVIPEKVSSNRRQIDDECRSGD